MTCARGCRLMLVGIISVVTSFGQAEVRRLTLQEAIHLALAQNRSLKLARLKVAENQQRKAGERSSYFPSLTNQSNALSPVISRPRIRVCTS